jgi:hypothetical protein
VPPARPRLAGQDVWAADGAASTGIFADATGQGSDTAYPNKNTAGPHGTLILSP